MKKVAVIYWSGTGNTQAMARFVADGAKEAGAQVELLTPGECDAALLDSMDAIAFGCPAMGAESSGGIGVRTPVCSLRSPACRQADCPVRLLRLGRRGVDEKLGGPMHRCRGAACLRRHHLRRRSGPGHPGPMQGGRKYPRLITEGPSSVPPSPKRKKQNPRKALENQGFSGVLWLRD